MTTQSKVPTDGHSATKVLTPLTPSHSAFALDFSSSNSMSLWISSSVRELAPTMSVIRETEMTP